MNFQDQLLFFFSALGAFNGLFLSLYFAFFIKNRNRTTYFLAALLFVISVRVTKSVFLTFYPGISSTFVQIGLTACMLIGPFLYLYVRVATSPERVGKWRWMIHIVPVIIFMIIVGILYPYRSYSYMWRRSPENSLGMILFLQWLTYVIAAFYQVRKAFKKLFLKTEKPTTLEYWLMNIVIGSFLIWLAYNTSNYTSYIVGALSFSFTFYITLMIWFFKRRTNALSFLTTPVKYANKKIAVEEASSIADRLAILFSKDKIHTNSNLKLLDVANLLEITPHALSQYLNDNVGLSFSNYINKHRIDTATKMIASNHHLTLEAIGNECGFKSNSTFYAAFKKYKGLTPAQFKKSHK